MVETTVMGGSHITPYIPISYVETNVVRSFPFVPILLVLDFQSAPGEAVVVHWGADKSITQVIHLGYVAAWNQLPRDGGGVTSIAGRRWKVLFLRYAVDLYVQDPIGIIFWMEGTDGGTD